MQQFSHTELFSLLLEEKKNFCSSWVAHKVNPGLISHHHFSRIVSNFPLHFQEILSEIYVLFLKIFAIFIQFRYFLSYWTGTKFPQPCSLVSFSHFCTQRAPTKIVNFFVRMNNRQDTRNFIWGTDDVFAFMVYLHRL